MRLYLVGGALRNLLLGLPARDRDFVWIGQESDLRARFPEAKRVGKAFPVHLHQGRELAPARGETIEADLLARDLTINALALELDDPDSDPVLGPVLGPVHGHVHGKVHAHPQALADLRHGWLRPASPRAFLDDPCRVFRLARFAAELPDFRVHREAVAAMRQAAAAGALESLDAERVGSELCKALAAPRPGRFLTVLDLGDCLFPWFDPLHRASAIPAGPAPWHGATSVLEHTRRIMDALAGDPLAVWLGLCHDLGKCLTPPDQWPHHYSHETRGGRPAMALAQRLRLSGRHRESGEAASLHHMKLGGYERLRPGTRVDLLDALLRRRLLEPMLRLAAADRAAVGQGDGFEAVMEQARQEAERLLAVRLPESQRELGPVSGRRLRELRCQAIVRSPRRATD